MNRIHIVPPVIITFCPGCPSQLVGVIVGAILGILDTRVRRADLARWEDDGGACR